MFSPSSHVFSKIYLHFNWHCHNNQGLITPVLEPELYKCIEAFCRREKGLWFKGIGGVEDHVHLVLQVEPFITPSEVVGKIKGSSSHEMNQLFGVGALKWQRGYGVVSFAERDSAAVLRYVANQKQHHQNGTANEALENWGHDEGPGPFG